MEYGEKIIEFIKEKFGKQIKGDLGSDTVLFTSGIIDSFGLLELVDFVEQSFGISIDPDEVNFDEFDSVNKIVEYIASKK